MQSGLQKRNTPTPFTPTANAFSHAYQESFYEICRHLEKACQFLKICGIVRPSNHGRFMLYLETRGANSIGKKTA